MMSRNIEVMVLECHRGITVSLLHHIIGTLCSAQARNVGHTQGLDKVGG